MRSIKHIVFVLFSIEYIANYHIMFLCFTQLPNFCRNQELYMYFTLFVCACFYFVCL